MPERDFANAFHVIRPLGVEPDGELLTDAALRAIHWMHRVGALVVVLVIGVFAWRLTRVEKGQRVGRLLGALLGAQVLLGLANVWFSLPVVIAVAHNGVAACLFALLVIIVYRLHKSG